MADMPGSGNGVNGSGDANNGKNISDEQLSEFMRGLFGDRGDDMIASMRERGMDPAHMLAQNGRLPDPATMQAALAQVKQMFAASGDDPVNTRLAHDLARQAAVKDGDPSIMAAQAKQAKDALSVAELWLDAATTLPPAGGQQYAWSRSEWVEATLPSWHRIVAPVASSMADALATVLGDGRVGGLELDIEIPADLLDNDPDDAASTDAAGSFAGGEVNLDQLGLGGLSPTDLIRKVGAAAFGMQVGQAAGTLSREVFGVTDVGLPLLDAPGTALLPSNVDGFADGLDIPADEVRLFLALREAAHARLFAHVPWVRPHLLGLVERYAHGISIDLDSLESRVRDVDPADPSGLHHALSAGGLFGVEATEAQRGTLLRLETALALVEGWVDEVTSQAALPHLPHGVQLREMLRRRRAAGGPAEQTFSSLVGLELRPRRSRDAATLFSHVYVAGGVQGRDAVWDHPDLLPGPIDLDDPAGYLARRQAQSMAQAEVDAALAEILDAADGQ